MGFIDVSVSIFRAKNVEIIINHRAKGVRPNKRKIKGEVLCCVVFSSSSGLSLGEWRMGLGEKVPTLMFYQTAKEVSTSLTVWRPSGSCQTRDHLLLPRHHHHLHLLHHHLVTVEWAQKGKEGTKRERGRRDEGMKRVLMGNGTLPL